ncbi:hypothetical protein [Aeromicrobium sp. UC242_57]|uniref:hypothetical protein n=1 Tax=Aeromicrobium sp. UC242_57 TaxID=3374624 RepID=UPI00378F20EB
MPRDFFALSPAVTASRMCINGPPVGLPNSAGSCIATNTVRPRVTADTAGIRPGTTLTADTGTWAAAGITWNYAFLWFRDGVPITTPEAATDPEYTVTDADRGTAITVKVTASQTGYGSGTAGLCRRLCPPPPRRHPPPRRPRRRRRAR